MADSMRPSNEKPSNRKLIGIAYPFQKKNGKFPYPLTEAQLIKNDIQLLFKTPLGSRMMRPQEGTDADNFVFEPQGDLLHAQLRRSIRQTILNSGITVVVISITFTDQDTQTLADIEYLIYGVRDNLTIAFEKETEF